MILKPKGFTLIELLVVVAIIGILAAVGVVAYNGYTSSAKIGVVKTNHNTVKKYIVTEITKWKNFYPAGENHNSFFENKREEPYCRFVILPKLKKFEMNFPSKLKKAED